MYIICKDIQITASDQVSRMLQSIQLKARSEIKMYVLRLRKFLVILTVLFVVMLFSLPAYAHPGRTDKIGGHRDSTTGEYHFHHGHEAHQHPDGICPFGDYEEWLAQHGEQAVYNTDVITYTNESTDENTINTWEGIGIGVGAAAVVSAAGFGVYKYGKKRNTRNTLQLSDQVLEFDPNMSVCVASNANRFHKTYGCCNAIDSMKLIDAIKDGREPCPLCCDESFMKYIEQLEVSEFTDHERGGDQETDAVIEMGDSTPVEASASEQELQNTNQTSNEVTISD